MSHFVALSLGPVALISVVSSINVFFAILFGWILTLIAPAVFKEGISRDELLHKAVWAIVLFVGIVLVS